MIIKKHCIIIPRHNIMDIGVVVMRAENITSRKNQYIQHLKSLCASPAYRREQGQYAGDGIKLLREALACGAEVTSVLWRGQAQTLPGLEGAKIYSAPGELFDYASPMKNSPGPVFTLRMPDNGDEVEINRAIALENVQDPGNVGTVIRTAAAFEIDAVILLGACADVYSPKTVRATMGAIFREKIIHTDIGGLEMLCRKSNLSLYGAALTDKARDVRGIDLKRAVVAIGSEGQGLSKELLSVCTGELIIPMTEGSESLNAAVAASIVLWEMAR